MQHCVLHFENHKSHEGVLTIDTLPRQNHTPLDEQKKSIRIMRRLLLGDVVNWITTEDPTIRHLEDYGSGNYPSE